MSLSAALYPVLGQLDMTANNRDRAGFSSNTIVLVPEEAIVPPEGLGEVRMEVSTTPSGHTSDDREESTHMEHVTNICYTTS